MTFKELLKTKGISMYKLAKDSKLGQATICEIANGNRTNIRFETALKIAKTLDVDVQIIKTCIGSDK